MFLSKQLPNNFNTQLGNNAPPPAWLCQLPGLTKWDGTNSNFTQLLSYDSTSQTPVTPLSKSAVCCAGVLNPCNSTILPNCITGFNGTAQCVNFLSDNNHCGNANTQCSAVGPCLNGQCIDLTNDPQHCGSLTTVCDQYSTCTNIACDSSSICSKGQCINTQIDPFNCGAPGISCKNATTCNAGTCVPNSCIPYINIWNLWPPGSNCCTTNSTIPGVSLICNSDYTVNTLAVIGNNNTPPIPTSGNNNTNPSSSGSSADSNTQALCSLVNTNLISLTLNNYPVIKQLPDCLCKAPNLTNIILPNNNLIGNIPDCFQNLPLVQLQLANNTGLGSNSQSIPSWLCAIPTLLLWDSTADALVQNSALPIQYNGMQTYTSLQKSSYCCKNAPNPCPASTPTCLVTPSGIGCTNLQKDPSNCGTIGNLCNNYSPYCSSGNCSSSPTGAATLCSSGSIWNIIQQRCISISTDTGNCGLLNYDCSAISPTSKCINGQCYDVSKDNYNCGTVGIKCNSTSTCVNGVCTQSTSYTDPTACGGKKCLNDWYVCKKITMKLSSCVPNCPLTWKYDPATNQCLNLLRDVHNCGQCNTTCTGMVPQCFGGNCYDFGVDSNNCGFYNNVCPDGLTCLWGICQ
ncbi:hypothetical protein BC830DRAFT_336968 [Chytriomyces sp. MP71]|nr:hypothetical protein BC830DRAFT_336968 [Chytriomyces sp. MP71]